MNGARSIFMRKGYWLTALVAAVLLAASPGTAQAQIVPDTEYDTDGFKVDGLGKTINEGGATVIQVSLRAMVEAQANATTVAVTVAITDPAAETPEDDTTDNADDGDVTLTGDTGSGVMVNLIFPGGGAEADAESVTYTRTANVYLGTGQDGDAEDEDFAVSFSLTNAAGVSQENIEVTIKDDETQTYVLTVTTDKPTEGMPGPDPLSWTPNPCGRRSPRCQDQGSRIRRSFASSWSRWFVRDVRRRIWPESLNRQPTRSATGWPRPIAMRAGGPTA